MEAEIIQKTFTWSGMKEIEVELLAQGVWAEKTVVRTIFGDSQIKTTPLHLTPNHDRCFAIKISLPETLVLSPDESLHIKIFTDSERRAENFWSPETGEREITISTTNSESEQVPGLVFKHKFAFCERFVRVIIQPRRQYYEGEKLVTKLGKTHMHKFELFRDTTNTDSTESRLQTRPSSTTASTSQSKRKAPDGDGPGIEPRPTKRRRDNQPSQARPTPSLASLPASQAPPIVQASTARVQREKPSPAERRHEAPPSQVQATRGSAHLPTQNGSRIQAEEPRATRGRSTTTGQTRRSASTVIRRQSGMASRASVLTTDQLRVILATHETPYFPPTSDYIHRPGPLGQLARFLVLRRRPVVQQQVPKLKGWLERLEATTREDYNDEQLWLLKEILNYVHLIRGLTGPWIDAKRRARELLERMSLPVCLWEDVRDSMKSAYENQDESLFLIKCIGSTIRAHRA